MGTKLTSTNPYLSNRQVRERTVTKSVAASSAIESINTLFKQGARTSGRRVVAAGELSQQQIDAISDVRVPDQYADLDKEFED